MLEKIDTEWNLLCKMLQKGGSWYHLLRTTLQLEETWWNLLRTMLKKVDTRWNLLCTMLQKLDSRLNLLSKLMQKIGLLRTMFQNVGTLLIVKFFVHHVCRRSKYDTISFAQFRRKYIGTSPIQWHLYSGDTSIQGTQNLVLKKRSHVTSIEGALLFRGKRHFFWVLKPGFNLHSGDTCT